MSWDCAADAVSDPASFGDVSSWCFHRMDDVVGNSLEITARCIAKCL